MNLIVYGAEIFTKALVVEDTAFSKPIVVGKHKICVFDLRSQRDADVAIRSDEYLTILAPFIGKKGSSDSGRTGGHRSRTINNGKKVWNNLGLSEVELRTKHTDLASWSQLPSSAPMMSC